MVPKKRNGSAIVDVLVAAAVILFVIFPLFSSVIEKYIMLNKVQIIKDAVDTTNISVYNALVTKRLGMQAVQIDYERAVSIFNEVLSANLKLEPDLTPKADSIAEGPVNLESLVIDESARTVHSSVTIPVKPSLYRQIILGAIGKNYITLEVVVDSEIPVSN